MAILRANEMREMPSEILEERIDELKQELNSEIGTVASGGKASNPGRIRELRRTIARALTIKGELKRNPPKKKEKPKTDVKKSSKTDDIKKIKEKPKDGVMKENA